MTAHASQEELNPMTSSTVHLVASNQVTPGLHRRVEQLSVVGRVWPRLRKEFVERIDAPVMDGRPSIAFLSRCIVLQSVGVAGIAALWIAGLAAKPFEVNGVLAALILGIGLIGVGCVFLQRWRDVQWIATHVVRIGLLGTVIGLIAAFSSVRGGGSNDPNQIREMIAAVVDGMYVSLYATLLGIACNLWLKVNLRLLGNFHG